MRAGDPSVSAGRKQLELLSRYGHEEGLLDKLGRAAREPGPRKKRPGLKQRNPRDWAVQADAALRARAPVAPRPRIHRVRMGFCDEFLARFPYLR